MASDDVSTLKTRVAAYCRVSTAMEAQLNSYENQMNYYTKYINENSDYTLVGIYGDEGKSGTGDSWRTGFQELIEDCMAGKIDMVITKSISRFARNTQDCLKYSRQLKELGIPILFEKEHINSMDGAGELFFTILSSLAQEESRSISENVKWGYRTLFQQGKVVVNAKRFYGFDKNADGKLIINEEQAAVVREIFHLFENGFTEQLIAKTLNERGIPGVFGEPRWTSTTINQLLTTEKNKGDLILQKTFVPDYLEKRSYDNTGQLDQYYVKNDHEAIVLPDEWDAVQMELERRKKFKEEHHIKCIRHGSTINAFAGKVICSKCGYAYSTHRTGKMRCNTRQGKGAEQNQCMNRDIDIYKMKEQFVSDWNDFVEERTSHKCRYEKNQAEKNPLEKLRTQQMIRFVEHGKINCFDEMLALATIDYIEVKKDKLQFHFFR